MLFRSIGGAVVSSPQATRSAAISKKTRIKSLKKVGVLGSKFLADCIGERTSSLRIGYRNRIRVEYEFRSRQLVLGLSVGVDFRKASARERTWESTDG